MEAGDLRPHGTDICAISARTGEGVDRLLEMIDQRLDKGTRRVRIHLPYDKGGLLDMLYRDAKVENVEYGETIDVTAVCPPPGAGADRGLYPGLGAAERGLGMTEYIVPFQDAESEFTESDPGLLPIFTRWRQRRRPCRIEETKKKYYDARHNCWCYLLRDGGVVRYSDDGEPQGTAASPC